MAMGENTKKTVYNFAKLKEQARKIGTTPADKVEKPTYHSVKLTANSPSVQKILYGIK